MAQVVEGYVQIADIPGESTDDKHKDWIEVLGLGHEIVQPVSSTKSSAGGASTGRTQHGNFVFTKLVDKASPKLNEAASNGKHLSKVKFEMCRAGGSQVKFYEITLEQVMVHKVQLHHGNGSGPTVVAGFTASGGSADATGSEGFPTETVHLNYGKIEWTYTQQKRADGSGGGNVTAKYDLTAGKS
jgi:type VI secretion system secreted protein Hcp